MLRYNSRFRAERQTLQSVMGWYRRQALPESQDPFPYADQTRNDAGFLSACQCDRLLNEARWRQPGISLEGTLVKLTGAFEVGRTPRSRCLVALITAGLLAGYGVMSPGQIVAEARIAESTATDRRPEWCWQRISCFRARSATLPLNRSRRRTLRPWTRARRLPTSSPPSSGDDVETLDQGSPPPAGGVEAVAPVGSVAGTYVAPAPATASAPSYAAPAESTSSGPYIPPGFGTGHVHVAAGHPEFPVGLASCHVGTITGRAYVGVDCPNGDSVVGFARSLDDFPFILNPDFPFEGDEGFLIDAARSDAAASDAGNNNVDVLAAMPGPQQDDSTSQTQIGVSGTGSVQYAQKTRTTEPTVETNTGQSGGKSAKKQQAIFERKYVNANATRQSR